MLRDCMEILLGGARGGGKTTAGIVWIGPAMPENRHPKFRGLVLRRNATDLADWLDRAKAMWIPWGVRHKVLKGTDTFFFPTGGIVRCGHLKDKNAYTKYQGHEYHKMLIEELTQIPEVDHYEKLIGSCRSSVPEIHPSILTTANPGGVGHIWVRDRFIRPAVPGTRFLVGSDGMERAIIFIPSTIEDNPSLLHDPQYLAYLESLPEALRRAWRHGDWDSFEGQYYPEFRRETHVIPYRKLPSWYRKYRSLDWGYWPDPWVCLWFAVDEHGHEILYREAQGHRMTPDLVARRILDLSKDDGDNWGDTVCDPSMFAKHDGVSSAEKMALAHLPLTPGNNDRIQGWMRIHEYLSLNQATGRPWLQIMDTCLRSIECLPLLVHDETRPEDAAGDSKIDHHPDAKRYHLMRRPCRASVPEPEKNWKTAAGWEAMERRILQQEGEDDGEGDDVSKTG
jgi:phage terminase large subunit